MINLNTIPANSVFTLVNSINNTDPNPTVILTWDDGNQGGKLIIDDDSNNDIVISELMVTASARSSKQGDSETFYLTNGALVVGKTNQIQFNTSARGIPDSEVDNPPTASLTRLFREHKKGLSIWLVSETLVVKGLNAQFVSTTTEMVVVAGEDIDATTQNMGVSLHTDGKYYKYHATNYPNLKGIISLGTSVLTDETFTLSKLNGGSLGYVGLDTSAAVYVENGGIITQTASATTTILGMPDSETSISHTEGVVFDKYDQSIDGVKIFTSNPKSASAPVDNDDLVNKEFAETTVIESLENNGVNAITLKNDLQALDDPTVAPTLTLSVTTGHNTVNGAWDFAISRVSESGETLISPSSSITITNEQKITVDFTSALSEDDGATNTRIYAKFPNGDDIWRMYGEVDENAVTFEFEFIENGWVVIQGTSINAANPPEIDISDASDIVSSNIMSPGFAGGTKQFGHATLQGYFSVSYCFISDDEQVSERSNYDHSSLHWVSPTASTQNYRVIDSLIIPGQALPPTPENGSPWVGIQILVEMWSGINATGTKITQWYGGTGGTNSNSISMIPLPADPSVNWNAVTQAGGTIGSFGRYISSAPVYEEYISEKISISNTTAGLLVKIQQEMPFSGTFLWCTTGQQPVGAINTGGDSFSHGGQSVTRYFVPS